MSSAIVSNNTPTVVATCVICQKSFDGWFGNNAMPVKDGLCCDRCNTEFVIPVRMSNETLVVAYATFMGRQIPCLMPMYFFPLRRSKRRRTPSLKARELIENGWSCSGERCRDTQDAWWVSRYLCHNYKF